MIAETTKSINPPGILSGTEFSYFLQSMRYLRSSQICTNLRSSWHCTVHMVQMYHHFETTSMKGYIKGTCSGQTVSYRISLDSTNRLGREYVLFKVQLRRYRSFKCSTFLSKTMQLKAALILLVIVGLVLDSDAWWARRRRYYYRRRRYYYRRRRYDTQPSQDEDMNGMDEVSIFL